MLFSAPTFDEHPGCSEVSSLTGSQSSANSISLLFEDSPSTVTSDIAVSENSVNKTASELSTEQKNNNRITPATTDNEVALELFPQYGEAYASHLPASIRTAASPSPHCNILAIVVLS